MKGMRPKSGMLVLLLCGMMLLSSSVYAQTIMYVPFDNRPVSLKYVTDTVKKAGFSIIVPPEEQLANRTQNAQPEILWQWVFDNARQADAIVLSADAMVYGGLVASRTHDISREVLLERVKNFKELYSKNTSVPIYIFSTIMRSPHASSGRVEPPYYETHGPAIFQIHALQDKQETDGLTPVEAWQLDYYSKSVPASYLADWLARREKNYQVNEELIRLVKEDVFRYMVLGRDDASPYSRSHRESRWLSRETASLSPTRYLSFPGADQLAMVMLTRAANDLLVQMPSIAVRYTDGAGAATVASYEDTNIGTTVYSHIIAAGCVPLLTPANTDMLLAVHTPADGWTREAGGGDNPAVPRPETTGMIQLIKQQLQQGRQAAVADVAYANGADNSLLAELAKERLLTRLTSYSGWNTASNTIGYTIGQAVFAKNTPPAARLDLLTVRFLDDWAYQANVRQELLREVVTPGGYSDVALNELRPLLIADTQRRMQRFAARNLPWLEGREIKVSYPWNRMFEIGITIE